MPEKTKDRRDNLPANRHRDAGVDKSENHHRYSDREGDHPDTTWTLEGLRDADAKDWLGSDQNPDVMLSVPNLGIDHIGLTVKDLRANVTLHAKVLDLLELNVGADVSLQEIDLDIDNVRVQAMLKVQLDKVVEVVGRVMDTIDANPEILTNLTAGIGKGVEGALSQGSTHDNSDGRKEIDGRARVQSGSKSDSSQSTNDEEKEESYERRNDERPEPGPGQPKRARQPRERRQPRGRRK